MNPAQPGRAIPGLRRSSPLTSILASDHPGLSQQAILDELRRAILSGAGRGHFGTGAGFWNVMRLYPDDGVGVVVMSKSTNSYDIEPLFGLLAGEEQS